MREFINLIERATAQRTPDDLADYDGDALKDDCTKCIPDELQHSDFAYLWWVGGDTDEMMSKRAAFCAADNRMSREEIPHADMVTGQVCVNPGKVASLMDSPAKGLPVIHKWNGNNILFDGNHRVVADILKGKKSSVCAVVDLNPYFDEDGKLRGDQD